MDIEGQIAFRCQTDRSFEIRAAITWTSVSCLLSCAKVQPHIDAAAGCYLAALHFYRTSCCMRCIMWCTMLQSAAAVLMVTLAAGRHTTWCTT